MGVVASTRGQVKSSGGANVIPDAAAIPAAHLDLLGLANAIEPRMVLRIPTIALVGTAPYSISPYEVGMIAVTTTSPSEVWVYTASSSGNRWQKIWPTTYSGTAIPLPNVGVDNDVYILY
jgi:hypothetical protein